MKRLVVLALAPRALHDVRVRACAVLFATVTLVAACGGEKFYSADAGAGDGSSGTPGASTADGARPGPSDAAADATPSAAASISSCRQANDDSIRTCTQDSDCARLNLGCYCGSQPVVGVSKANEPRMKDCEDARRSTCSLGCAQTADFKAEDQSVTSDRSKINVICLDFGGSSGTCRTYVGGG